MVTRSQPLPLTPRRARLTRNGGSPSPAPVPYPGGVSAPELAVPDPRVPGTSRWYVVGSLARAGVLVVGGLALLAMVGWPEDHVEVGSTDSHQTLIWDDRFPHAGGSSYLVPGLYGGPAKIVHRDDSVNVLLCRMEQGIERLGLAWPDDGSSPLMKRLERLWARQKRLAALEQG